MSIMAYRPASIKSTSRHPSTDRPRPRPRPKAPRNPRDSWPSWTSEVRWTTTDAEDQPPHGMRWVPVTPSVSVLRSMTPDRIDRRPTPEDDAEALAFRLGEALVPASPPEGATESVREAFERGYQLGLDEAQGAEDFHREEQARIDRDVLGSAEGDMLDSLDRLIDEDPIRESDLYRPGETS